MILDKDTCSLREEWVVASVLSNLSGKWGPSLATVLAYWREWENPVAQRIAKAITESTANLTKANISIHLAPEDAMWLLHPTFLDGINLQLAEWEAEGMLPRYEAKRVRAIFGKAYSRSVSHPEEVGDIARTTMEELKVICGG